MHNLYLLYSRKKTKFHGTRECQNAFDQLKQRPTLSPILAYPDFTKPFIVETDACKSDLGAVLEQEQENGQLHPIAFVNRTLQAHANNYGISEMEALWAMKHFRPHSLGH